MGLLTNCRMYKGAICDSRHDACLELRAGGTGVRGSWAKRMEQVPAADFDKEKNKFNSYPALKEI